MDWHVTPMFGLKDTEFVKVEGEDEPGVVIHVEVQAGVPMRVHMNATEWRWLGIELHKKKLAEDQRLGIE
ncbi:hypothetical protein [Streptomyces sp. MJM1172]|uniref:hypothetical protein n=1 Tax=Streptomyces sp. MJM1172 TaxID=1703926 RepID=UPI00093C4971|nr:hypothetical protein [Streptomyces sp. MJM1172]OKI71383.1 hypothetical protein AMK15_01785 [Streptomyces sp. MJM1172]